MPSPSVPSRAPFRRLQYKHSKSLTCVGHAARMPDTRWPFARMPDEPVVEQLAFAEGLTVAAGGPSRSAWLDSAVAAPSPARQTGLLGTPGGTRPCTLCELAAHVHTLGFVVQPAQRSLHACRAPKGMPNYQPASFTSNSGVAIVGTLRAPSLQSSMHPRVGAGSFWDANIFALDICMHLCTGQLHAVPLKLNFAQQDVTQQHAQRCAALLWHNVLHGSGTRLSARPSPRENDDRRCHLHAQAMSKKQRSCSAAQKIGS
eukprot:364509-Chlamydomonas_euryale.AAC.15